MFTSQLLVNIYMNEFDQFIKRGMKVQYYLRYADDFAILSRDKNYLESMMPHIDGFLGDGSSLPFIRTRFLSRASLPASTSLDGFTFPIIVFCEPRAKSECFGAWTQIQPNRLLPRTLECSRTVMQRDLLRT